MKNTVVKLHEWHNYYASWTTESNASWRKELQCFWMNRIDILKNQSCNASWRTELQCFIVTEVTEFQWFLKNRVELHLEEQSFSALWKLELWCFLKNMALVLLEEHSSYMSRGKEFKFFPMKRTAIQLQCFAKNCDAILHDAKRCKASWRTELQCIMKRSDVNRFEK